MRSFLEIETTTIIQATFLSALAFLGLYTALHRWWTTVHGLSLGALALGVAFYNLRPTLFYWHLVMHSPALEASERAAPDATALVLDQFRWLLPAVFLVMTWQLIRFRLSKRKVKGDGTLTKTGPSSR